MLLAGVCVLGCSNKSNTTGTTSSVSKVEWRMANTWTSGMPILEEATTMFAERIAKASGGKFTVRVDASNKHKAPLGIFDLVRTGQYQMGHTASYYWKGINPAMSLLTTVPFGMTAFEQYSWFYQGGGLELQDKLYAPHGLYSFPGGNTGIQMGGWFNKEIKTVEDLKGLKMRIPGMAGDVLARVGASPTNIPPGELYTALERGTIDALEWVNPAVDLPMGFQQIAQYYYTGWHEPAAELQFLINRKAYDALPEVWKELLISTMKEATFDTMVNGYAKNIDALEQLKNQYPDVEIRAFPPEVLEALKRATQEVLSDIAGTSPEAKAIVESLANYQKKAAAWTAISEQRYLESR